MFSRLAVTLRLHAIPRATELDDRATVLILFARFIDELCSGLLVVLMPTFRRRLGLTVEQVGWCFQVMFSVGAIVEPVTSAAIDLRRRRPLVVVGAAGWAAALLLAAGAPSFGWLVAAFAVAGAAYGPLANTADVVLIEGHPDAVERISSRSTQLDTVGALLAPGLVALGGWAGVDGRILLLVTAAGVAGYAALLVGTVLPSAMTAAGGPRLVSQMTANLRVVLSDRRGRLGISALMLVEVLGLSEVFEPVWLRDVVEVSQSLIAVHVATGLAASLLALTLLDRWLTRHDALVILVACCIASAIVYPAWLLVPGYPAKLAFVALRDAVMAPLWPLLHARALAALPGKAGAVTAWTALIAVLPLHAVFGWLAESFGFTATMLGVPTVAFAGLLRLLLRERARPERSAPR